MSYALEFKPKALKEWKSLDATIRKQFYKKLVQRLEEPRVPHDKLSGFADVYKIKLRSSGYRLAYEVVEDRIVVVILKIGRRDGAYRSAKIL